MPNANFNENGGLIGKYLPLTEPTFDEEAGMVKFRGRHSETGVEEDIELPARAMSTHESESSMRLPQNTGNAVFDAIVEWFLFGDEFKGAWLFCFANSYGIHGIGAPHLLALGSDYLDSPVALFHEAAEVMGANGKLDAETISLVI